MRFAMLIDYANYFESIKKINNISKVENIEETIVKSINALCEYIENPSQYNREKVKIIAKIAYVLPNEYYGKPENKLQDAGIIIKRVKEDKMKKTENMKKMNSSRADDAALNRDAKELVLRYKLDGIIVVSNDGDFANLSDKLRYKGRYFWTGIMEGEGKNKTFNIKASKKLKNKSDRVLPIHEIITGMDEGVPILEGAEENYSYKGNRIEVYRGEKFLFSYPIDKKVINLGRRSSRRYHFPHIDLTDYDEEKIISRQHADIHLVGNRIIFAVHQNCTRGTWHNCMPIKPCQQFIMKPFEPVIIGEKDGFIIVYAND